MQWPSTVTRSPPAAKPCAYGASMRTRCRRPQREGPQGRRAAGPQGAGPQGAGPQGAGPQGSTSAVHGPRTITHLDVHPCTQDCASLHRRAAHTRSTQDHASRTPIQGARCLILGQYTEKIGGRSSDLGSFPRRRRGHQRRKPLHATLTEWSARILAQKSLTRSYQSALL